MSPTPSRWCFLVPGKWGDTPAGPLSNGLVPRASGLSRRAIPISHASRGAVTKTSLRICWPRSNVSRRTGPFFSRDTPWEETSLMLSAERLSKRGRSVSALLVLDTDAEPYDTGPPAKRRGLAQRVSTLGRLAWKRDWATIAEAVLTPIRGYRPVGSSGTPVRHVFSSSDRQSLHFRLNWHLRSMLVQFHRGAWIRHAPPPRLNVPVVLFRSRRAASTSLGGPHREADHRSGARQSCQYARSRESEDLVAEFNRAVHTAWGHNAALSEG